jgi:crotonobetaine/carnitine-CoA ligase
VVRDLIELRAQERPDRVYAIFDGGESWTYRRLRDEVLPVARGLQELGVKQGDRVLVWLPTGATCLKVWFAINYLGATFVPINTAYKGRLLEHVVRNCGAHVGVVHASLAQRLNEVDRSNLQTIVCVHGAPVAVDGCRVYGGEALAGDPAQLEPPALPVEPWDEQTIIFTSGTTGASKGVMMSYVHMLSTGEGFWYLDENDRMLVNLPMFHIGGTIFCHVALVRGGSIAMVESFQTERFWSVINSLGVTYLYLLGVMAAFVMKRQETSEEKDTTLRHFGAIPLSEEAIAFGKRYGCTTYSVFNMTEISCPLVTEANPKVPNTCGRPRPGVDVRLVDEHDCEVPRGTTGELIVRTDRPWAMNSGYNGDPEATARAWRNGWFHTGDAFRQDDDGNFFFVDRIKDTIRRRGENISSMEVEADLCLHPAIREAAAVAVKSDVSEDEVLVAVSFTPGGSVEPADLIEFLMPRMSHFMIPRYIRIMDSLPRTPTQKVQKHIIRAEGITADTWDREKAGIVIRREKLAT